MIIIKNSKVQWKCFASGLICFASCMKSSALFTCQVTYSAHRSFAPNLYHSGVTYDVFTTSAQASTWQCYQFHVRNWCLRFIEVGKFEKPAYLNWRAVPLWVIDAHELNACELIRADNR